MTSWPWMQMLAVALGAAIGALLRWAAGLALSTPGSALPLGTLVVNCVGGLLVGLALAGFQRWPNELLRLCCVTGFLGGLTTFSTFSAESLVLLEKGQLAAALGHTLAHVVGALACAVLGVRAGRWLWGA